MHHFYNFRIGTSKMSISHATIFDSTFVDKFPGVFFGNI